MTRWHGTAVTPAEIAEVRRLSTLGFTCRQIADIRGVGTSRIEWVRRRHQITGPTRGRPRDTAAGGQHYGSRVATAEYSADGPAIEYRGRRYLEPAGVVFPPFEDHPQACRPEGRARLLAVVLP